jgi:hypothetical protein
MADASIIETPFAWLERINAEVVVQRWKPGTTLDVPTIKATMELRHAHFGDTPYAAIVIVPEGTRFAMSFLENDQYKNTEVTTSMFAMANVVEEEDVRAIVELYYAQHPPAYAFGVFALLTDAMTWVEERVAERGPGAR